MTNERQHRERIREITERNKEMTDRLLSLWERSVRSTHTFLTEEDILAIKPEADKGIRGIEYLCAYMGEDGPLGFVGIDSGKIEMLFVDDCARGMGIGRALADYAVKICGAYLVDVNEQNPQAVGFYKAIGFQLHSRSECDGAGRPFPILHLILQDDPMAKT